VPPLYDAAAHLTTVAVDHEVLLHCTDSSSDAEGLGSFEAKLSPSRVITDAPPDAAAFAGLMLVKAGAAQSNKRSWCCTSDGAQRRKRP
jgi:hypothetical protein